MTTATYTSPTSPLMTPDQTSAALGITRAELSALRHGNAGPNFHGIDLGLIRYNTADVVRWRASRALAETRPTATAA
ncbi:hypothetical protein [Cryobacterium sp. GrIS_2_6]|uniref:hypothetical protein n=1 Tax=Cryobacterium sp. GrIS_2_6 TaxID=3162785 RepID=UPI002E023534|nr:hypothetical protein [Cryobacterium psychrotolerans]